MQIDGTVALVTGGGSGLGAATAAYLAYEFFVVFDPAFDLVFAPASFAAPRVVPLLS